MAKVDFEVKQNHLIVPGVIVLKRGGKIVWFGSISAPWEDVHCDSAEVSKEDFERLFHNLSDQERREANGANLKFRR